MKESTKATPEDPGTSEIAGEIPSAPRSGVFRLLLTIVPFLLLPALGGAYLAYSQYPRLAHAAAKTGIAGDAAGEESKEKGITYGHFATISELLINPAGSGGKGFLVVTLGLEAKSTAVITELEEKDIVVRDAILRILSKHTKEELASIELRSGLKHEILGELNTVLSRGQVDRLYFTQFLLQ